MVMLPKLWDVPKNIMDWERDSNASTGNVKCFGGQWCCDWRWQMHLLCGRPVWKWRLCLLCARQPCFWVQQMWQQWCFFTLIGQLGILCWFIWPNEVDHGLRGWFNCYNRWRWMLWQAVVSRSSVMIAFDLQAAALLLGKTDVAFILGVAMHVFCVDWGA